MNVDRINQYISDLFSTAQARAGSARENFIDMGFWQIGDNSHGRVTGPTILVENLDEFHGCGNTACAGGYLALTDQFKAVGGGPSPEFGSPVLPDGDGNELRCEKAFAEFFGFSIPLADAITACLTDWDVDDDILSIQAIRLQKALEDFVEREWQNWDVQDLIKIMSAIRDGEIDLVPRVSDRFSPDEADHAFGEGNWVYDDEA